MVKKICKLNYQYDHMVICYSLPWKITMLLSSVNHLFLWTIYTMAMLVITRGYSKYQRLSRRS